MGFFISILPEKEREWSQGTVRWTQSVRAALDVMTRSTLFQGKEMFFSCLPARAGSGSARNVFKCPTSFYN